MKTACIATALLFGMCLIVLGGCGGDGGGAPTTIGPSPAATTEASLIVTQGATPELTPSPQPTATPEPAVVWSGGPLGVVLDRVERAKVLPADVESPSSSPSQEPPTPGEGYDYVCVYLTITSIDNVHVVNAWSYGDEESSLRDAEGHGYELAFGQVRGLRFLDPNNLTASYEVTEGASAVLVFKIPTHEKPASLSLVYSFKQSWEEASPQRGQVDITL